MGADQTRVCKDNHENATLKNVRSIDDCSPRGLNLQRKANVANNTGLPNNLKNGVEALSGYSLDNVRVHYNSSKPAAVQAYAYTQGTDIHIAPGQESCLPHEAWHVTQQMSGRVSPTTSIGGVAVNDEASLEHEADVMGARASTLQGNSYAPVSRKTFSSGVRQNKMTSSVVQRVSVPLKDDAEAINAFKRKNYAEYDYQSGKNGRFNAEYSPSSKLLIVTLPVCYDDSMLQTNSDRVVLKDFFKNNVEKTWSKKYHIGFRGTRQVFPRLKNFCQSSSGKTWKSELNSVEVDVKVEEVKRNDAFFYLRSVSGQSRVMRDENDSNRRIVEMRTSGLRDGNGSRTDSDYPTLNASAHEAGHMFGFGDEYRVADVVETPNYDVHLYRNSTLRFVDRQSRLQEYDLEKVHADNGKICYNDNNNDIEYSVGRISVGNDTFYYLYYIKNDSLQIESRSLDGTVSTHYDLVKEFFSADHANKNAVMHDNQLSSNSLFDVLRKGTSIMRDGDKVEKRHYVTFADAMVQAIQKKYPSVPSPDAPNTRGDWEIK